MQDSFVLMQLMALRICHDLASPLGALSLGLEVGGGGPLYLESLLSSSHWAKMKLSFYRTFLSVSQDSPTGSNVQEILQNFCEASRVRGNKIDVDFDLNALPLTDGYFCRLLLGIFFLATEGLPRGGVISLSSRSPHDFTLTGKGPIAQLYSAPVFNTDQTLQEQTPRTILPYYLRLLAKQNDQDISYSSVSHDEFRLSLVSHGDVRSSLLGKG